MAEAGNVTYKNQQADDVTAQYMDVETRLENLKNQRTRLQQLQQQADNLSDLLEIESSLTDVQSQIESWEHLLAAQRGLRQPLCQRPFRWLAELCGWPAAGHRCPCRCMAGGGDRSRRLRRVRGLEKEEKINQKNT